MVHYRNWIFQLTLTLNVFGLFLLTLVCQNLTTLPKQFLHTNFSRNEIKVKESKISKISSSKVIPCDDHNNKKFEDSSTIRQHGQYWILQNYFRARRHFRCDESITYSTHGDWTFLMDNLPILLDRWQGPVSLTLYTPGSDFDESLRTILFLRECSTDSRIIKDLVTFHLYFPQGHVPHVPQNVNLLLPVNCDDLGKKVKGRVNKKVPTLTYRKFKNLTYPVNVARNVAREMSSTYFVLASDIELYPSPGLIKTFLRMVRQNPEKYFQSSSSSRKVFVLSIFELNPNVKVLPVDKRELIFMLGNRMAIPFHKWVCPMCHRIPGAEDWLKKIEPESRESVIKVAKRQGEFRKWEPIFIGTKNEPVYDERLTWEGKQDKMTQAYAMCVLNYEFHILSQGFLVHKPGVKTLKNWKSNQIAMSRQHWFINRIILPELGQIYGAMPNCSM